jgi:predicted ATPase
MQGWGLAVEDCTEERITQMQKGLTATRATGSEAIHPYYFALLAETYGKMGQPEEGLVALAEASAMMQRTGERWYEAELYRLKGELLLTQEIKSQNAKVKSQKSKVETNPQPLAPSTQAEVEECFLKAIEIARKQQAKSLELRTVTSLVRLRQHQVQHHAPRTTQHASRSKLDEAHKMLSVIYDWFTEGFDTKDLQEAKTLLEELDSGGK